MFSITLTVNDPDAERVSKAFGKQMNLPLPAGEEEIKIALTNYIRQVTLQQEQQVLYAEAQQEGTQIPPVVVA
jgi:hypothetical protein